MRVRGPIVAVGDVREAGGTELIEVTVRPDRGASAPTQVTLWGDWTHTASHAEPGMELLVTDAEKGEFRGETTYETTPESHVVLEPDFLVDVTDVRSWVQCPRMYYLNKLSGVPLEYPVVKGTIVHEVFGDLLRGGDLEASVRDRVADAGLELGLLGRSAREVEDEVRRNAAAVDGWLQQGRLSDASDATGVSDGTETDATDDGNETGDGTDGEKTSDGTDGGGWTRDGEWRSERTLIAPTFGMKGRADAIRRGNPVELKTGKNTRREPRFQDKIQAACYALMLRERGVEADTGTLLYTKNAALDRGEADGDLSPAKEFSIGPGLLRFVVRTRNEIAAMEADAGVPTGYEADATCEYCFEQDACMVVSGRLDQESKAGQIGRAVPPEERAYFERFYAALEAEREAVHAEYRKLWEQSAAERADDDRALIGLDPVGRRKLSGGRWELWARTPDDAVSKLRVGDLALASDGDPVTGDAELARIVRLGDDTSSVGGDVRPPSEVAGQTSDDTDPCDTGTDDPSPPSDDTDADAPATTTAAAASETDGGDWVAVRSDEPVPLRRLDVYPTELSVDRSITALHDAVLKGDERRKDVLFGRREPAFGETDKTFVPNNDAQDRAVRRAVTAEDFALIHGPPGTGKTFTIAETVRALVARGERVLLAAFTNRAVDNALAAVRDRGLAEPLARRGWERGDGDAFERAVVRVGTRRGVRGDMQSVRLVERGDPAERAAELADTPVVAATTATCGNRVMRDRSFDVAVVDEASQLTEPATLAAIERADRFVLVGDHLQLPPVVQSDAGESYVPPARRNGEASAEPDADTPASLRQSLFQRLIERCDEPTDRPRASEDDSGANGEPDTDGESSVGGDSDASGEFSAGDGPDAGGEPPTPDGGGPSPSVTLTRQYRMSQRIQAFPSAAFYDGRLAPATREVAAQSLAELGVDVSELPPALRGVGVVDPDGERDGNRNVREAERVAEIVDRYVASGVDPDDVGVIAPFRAQVAEIRRRTDVTVDTVDRFQGSSKEVIVVSFVATESLDSPIFADERRVNVALTRAKKALVLVGSRTALRSDPLYERMLSWADR